MKALLILLVSVLVLSTIDAVRYNRYRSSRRRYNGVDRYNRLDRLVKAAEAQEEEPEVIEENESVEANRKSKSLEVTSDDKGHPCLTLQCEAGEECYAKEDGGAACRCRTECADEFGPRVQVCTTQNVTFANECAFHRMHCLCQSDDAQCEQQRYRNAHLDYYGECTEIKECTESQMQDFPKRMRTWLYLIMEELDNRKSLNEAAHEMIMEAKQQKHKWVLPVIWKFCDLDKTHDRMVTSEEMKSITAPLKPIEHCTGPFVEGCDSDNDGNITLDEWSVCLGLDREEIEDRCDKLQS